MHNRKKQQLTMWSISMVFSHKDFKIYIQKKGFKALLFGMPAKY